MWIRLPGLPVIYWGARTLSRIVSAIGVPLFADECTTKQSRISFARVLVEVDITKPLPTSIKYINENGDNMEQKVTYDWVPFFCSKCQKVGHKCSTKRPVVVQKWVPKRSHPQPTSNSVSLAEAQPEVILPATSPGADPQNEVFVSTTVSESAMANISSENIADVSNGTIEKVAKKLLTLDIVTDELHANIGCGPPDGPTQK